MAVGITMELGGFLFPSFFYLYYLVGFLHEGSEEAPPATRGDGRRGAYPAWKPIFPR